MFLRKKGQSTLEYIIIFTAIVAVLLAAAKWYIKPAVYQGMNDSATALGKAGDKFIE